MNQWKAREEGNRCPCRANSAVPVSGDAGTAEGGGDEAGVADAPPPLSPLPFTAHLEEFSVAYFTAS